MARATADTRSLLPPLWILTLLACAFLIWLASTLKELLVLIILGYAIAYLIEPLILRITRRRFSRPFAFTIVSLGFILFFVLLALTALPTLLREYDRLSAGFPGYIVTAKEKLGPLLSNMGERFGASANLQKFLDSPLTALDQVKPEHVSQVVVAAGSAVVGGYSLTLTLLNLILLPFIVFYLSVDFPSLHRQAILLFPRTRREKVRAIFKKIHTHVSAFVSSQIIVCTILCVLYSLSLGIIGVDLWFLLAVISGFGNLVPYVGTVTGIVLSSVMALVTFGDWSHLIQVWVAFALISFVEGSFITPRVMGKNVGLSPLVVLLALVAAGQLFGLLGLLLAIPMTAVAKVLLSELHTWLIEREGAQIAE